MTTSLPHAEGVDPETPLSVLRRFGITTLEENFDDFTVVASMPLAGMVNPYTAQPSLAGLAVLVDDVAGRVNYYRRGRGVWTVSSELTVEITPDAVAGVLAAPDEPVIATARPLGPPGATLLSVCTLTHAGTVIGGGTVHTMPLAGGPEEPLRRGDDPLVRTARTTLAELMAAEPMGCESGTYRMRQSPDPMVGQNHHRMRFLPSDSVQTLPSRDRVERRLHRSAQTKHETVPYIRSRYVVRLIGCLKRNFYRFT